MSLSRVIVLQGAGRQADLAGARRAIAAIDPLGFQRLEVSHTAANLESTAAEGVSVTVRRELSKLLTLCAETLEPSRAADD